jgi:hypothetical protein
VGRQGQGQGYSKIDGSCSLSDIAVAVEKHTDDVTATGIATGIERLKAEG